jgi:hypothetical protein
VPDRDGARAGRQPLTRVNTAAVARPAFLDLAQAAARVVGARMRALLTAPGGAEMRVRMTGGRAAVPELSAYREGARCSFPWATVNWSNFYIGAGLGGMICLIVFFALLGWAG